MTLNSTNMANRNATSFLLLVALVFTFLVALEAKTAPQEVKLVHSDDDVKAAHSNTDVFRVKRTPTDKEESMKMMKGAGLENVTGNRKVLEYFTKLPENVKNELRKGNISAIPINSVRDMNTTLIEHLPKKFVMEMNKEQVKTILDKLLNKDQMEGLGRILGRMGKDKIDCEELTRNIKTKFNELQGNDLKQKRLQGVFRSFLSTCYSKPKEWTVANIDTFGHILLKNMPPQVLGKMNQDAAKRTLAMLATESSCDSTNMTRRGMFKLAKVGYGEVQSWKNTELEELRNIIPCLPVTVLNKMNATQVKNAISSLKFLNFKKPIQRRVLCQKVLKVSEIDKKNKSTDVTSIIDELSGIIQYCPPSFINRINATIRNTTVDHILSKLISVNLIPKALCKKLLKAKLANKSIDNLQINDPKLKPILSCAPRTIMKKAIKDGALDVGGIRKVLENTKSLSKGMEKLLCKKTLDSNTASIPAKCQKFISNDKLKELSAGEIIDRKFGSTDMSQSQRALLSDKIVKAYSTNGQQLAKVDPSIRTLISPKVLEKLSADGLNKMAENMPAKSAIGIRFNMAVLKNKILTADMIFEKPNLLATVTDAQTRKISTNNVTAVLTAARSVVGPTRKSARVLKAKLLEHQKEIMGKPDASEEEVLKAMDTSDLNNMDGAVLSEFSIDALKGTTPENKAAILTAICDLKRSEVSMLDRKKLMTIVDEGLKAQILGFTSCAEDCLPLLTGPCAMTLPSNTIKRMSLDSLEALLPLIEGMSPEDMAYPPCLDTDQRNALASTIKENYGKYPDQWNDTVVQIACCSLKYLSKSDLNKITDERILNCECMEGSYLPAQLESIRMASVAKCKYELGSKYAELEEGQMRLRKRRSMAAMNVATTTTSSRRKRATTTLTCDVVSQAGSAAGFTTGDLETMTGSTVQECLADLGTNGCSKEQAKVIWKKLNESYTNGAVPDAKLQELGCVAHGLTADDIKKLDLSNSDTIASLGVYRMLTKEQLDELANQVKSDWGKQVSSYTSLELTQLGHILCGFTKTDIEQISATAYVSASSTLKSLQDCKAEVLMGFATLAKKNEAFGDPSTWTAAEVEAVGSIIGGLSADEFRNIPPEAMSSLSTTAVKSIPVQNMAGIKIAQMQNFPVDASLAITAQQKDQFSAELMEVFTTVAGTSSIEQAGDGARGLTASSFLVCVTLLFTVLQKM